MDQTANELNVCICLKAITHDQDRMCSVASMLCTPLLRSVAAYALKLNLRHSRSFFIFASYLRSWMVLLPFSKAPGRLSLLLLHTDSSDYELGSMEAVKSVLP